MHQSIKHLRLLLAQTLFSVRWRVVNDYHSWAEPFAASNADFDSWVSRTVVKLNELGGSSNASDVHPDGGLKPLFEFLTEDEQGLLGELTAIATWWAAAHRASSWWPWQTTRQARLDALASVLWHLKRSKEVAIAERAGEHADVFFWNTAKELATALGDAAKLF